MSRRFRGEVSFSKCFPWHLASLELEGTRLLLREGTPPRSFRPPNAHRWLDGGRLVARMHLAWLSTTLIAMGASILYRSIIRHSRSSPSCISNPQVAMSVNSGRTIVKSSISFRILHRRSIFLRENGAGLSG